LNVPIYEQSVNVGDIILVRWRATWRISASYMGTAHFWAWSHENRRNMVICCINLLQKGISPEVIFAKFGVGEGVPGPYNHAKFCRCGFKNVGLEPPK